VYVVNGGCGEIGQYTLGSDAGTISSSNPNLISGLGYPRGIAASGSNLFVTDSNANAIDEFDTSGNTLAAPLVSALQFPWGIATDGSNLFVANYAGSSSIGEYGLGADPGTLASSIPTLVTGANFQQGIANLGSNLFVTNWANGTIGEFTTSGDAVNPALVSNVPGVSGIAVVADDDPPGGADDPPVPEPATASILLVAGMGLLMRRSRKQTA
jgi:hypothetical protein